MGLLRLILALTVVIAHSQPLFKLSFTGPVIAVQSFYIISGFYMALILNEKYVGPGSYRLFITNRLLRIFPVYWVVLVLTIVLFLVFEKAIGTGITLDLYREFIPGMGFDTLALLIFSNLLIFGQEAITFLKLNAEGSLMFTPDFNLPDPASPPLFMFLFDPPGWSLSLELMFYFIAPFLVRRGLTTIAMLILASLLLRAFIYSMGLYHDPWTFRFFPTEIAFFLFGSLSYRLYKRFNEFKSGNLLGLAALVLILAYTVFFEYITVYTEAQYFVKQWAYYLMMALGVPAIFHLTKNNKLDNYLGEFSYPLYISHIFVLYGTTYKVLERADTTNIYLITLAATLIFTGLLVHFVVKPIERLRLGRVKKAVLSI